MTRLSATDKEGNIQLIKQLSKKCFLEYPIMAQLTAAQAILEGGLGRVPPSQLALNHCNLFGMKPGFIRQGTGTPGIVYLPTKEYIQNQGLITMNQPFLNNDKIEDSLDQHFLLFDKLDRYQDLWECKTFEDIANAVHEAGYATDKNYSSLLISVYQEYELNNL